MTSGWKLTGKTKFDFHFATTEAGLAPLTGEKSRPKLGCMKKFFKTILMVEPDANDEFLITRAFRKAGVTDAIQVVPTGEEAIAYMNGEGKYADRHQFAYPTFILTELKMSHGDGFDVLQHLKSNPDWAIIPTVVVSSSTDLDDIKTAYGLGASAYHVKPQELDKLNEMIATLYAYWLTCEVPEVDSSGKQLPTDNAGKLGERFSPPVHAGHFH